MRKGAYTPQARPLAHELVKAGCAQESVGSIIQLIARNAGISVKNQMTCCTVDRAIIEGGLAAQVQLGYELSQAKGILIVSV